MLWKRSVLNKRLRGFAAALLILAIGTAAIAQNSAWELGPYRLMAGISSGPLRVPMRAGALGLPAFLSAVGGIAFKGVAVPGASLAGKQIQIVYDRQAPDGRRLAVGVDKVLTNQSLPDWLLIPIARYADSKTEAAVSLFGPNTDENAFDIVYHESFQNELLGLRLLQADMLLIDPDEMWRLPQQNGKTVLGLGENAPQSADRTAIGRLTSIMHQR